MKRVVYKCFIRVSTLVISKSGSRFVQMKKQQYSDGSMFQPNCCSEIIALCIGRINEIRNSLNKLQQVEKSVFTIALMK